MMWVIDTSALIRLYVPDGPLHPEAPSRSTQRGQSRLTVLIAARRFTSVHRAGKPGCFSAAHRAAGGVSPLSGFNP